MKLKSMSLNVFFTEASIFLAKINSGSIIFISILWFVVTWPVSGNLVLNYYQTITFILLSAPIGMSIVYIVVLLNARHLELKISLLYLFVLMVFYFCVLYFY